MSPPVPVRAGAARGLAAAIAVLLVLGVALLPGRVGSGGSAAGKGATAALPRPVASAAPPSAAPPGEAAPSEAPPGAAPPSAAPPSPAPDAAPAAAEAPAGEVLVIPYRVEVRSPDPALVDAPSVIAAILADPRGWAGAAIRFEPDPDAPYAIVVAEGPEAQELCQPYDVGGAYSCQNGPLVVLNATRWREGVDHWPGDLASYRTMLVNHEVGHLIGMHHLRCPGPGQVAPVMEQQSGTLRGCTANPWPTPVELQLAATHQFEIAPPPRDVPFPQ